MPAPPFNRQALLDIVDGDADFLETLVNAFLEDCPSYVDGIRQAVAAQDAEALVREAHGLKGAVANLRAEPARRAAHRLEEMGRNESLDDAPDAIDTLEQELERLRTALTTFVEEVQEEA